MANPELEEKLSLYNLSSVYFGSAGFQIFSPSELEEAQIGYSTDTAGQDLTSSTDGNWQPDWIAIGYDTNIGDPFFVDLGKKGFPVLTAWHGEGRWDPSPVSNTVDGFLSCLQLLKLRFNQVEPLIEPNASSVRKKRELKALAKELTELNGGGKFWKEFIENYIDWAEENSEP